VRYTKPEVVEGSQNWLLGTVSWSGRELPVVAFEGTIGKEIPASTGRTRIVVFYSSGGTIKSGYFGLVTQGFPQLVRLNREVLRFDSAEGWGDEAPVLCRVKMINEFPLIPDLDKLEEMIVDESLQA
jgi:chemosensory pili system protein ChpC